MNNKHSKNSRTLSMYVRLCAGKRINKAEEANRFGVDERSIQRDIDDIRAFLEDQKAESTAESREIVYDRIHKGFVMTGTDGSAIKDKLEQIIRGTIENFKREMLEAFKNETDFDEKTVYIFKAGNSSRNEFVDKIMKDEFPQNERIQLVDETAKNDDKVNKRYAITPKTAVAFGQLKLNNIEIEGDDATFRYYLGYFTPGKNKFKVCVDKNAADTREWHKFQKIKNDQIDVFYARSMPADGDYKAAKHVTLDVPGHVGDVLFIRILNDSTFQYCIGNSDNPAGLPEDVSVGQEVLN